MWVNRLKWAGLPSFSKLRWTPLDDPASPGVTGAFFKTYKNFSFYWILRAGHMVTLALSLDKNKNIPERLRVHVFVSFS